MISLIFVIYYAWLTSSDASGDGGRVSQLAGTVALFVVALLADILPYFAVKKVGTLSNYPEKIKYCEF